MTSVNLLFAAVATAANTNVIHTKANNLFFIAGAKLGIFI
jgi:hypothetical protein